MTISTFKPFGEIIAYAIGGGWGSDEPTGESQPVRVIRGADFPEVALQRCGSLPLRYETKKRVLSRRLKPNDILLEISGGTGGRPTGRTVYITEDLLSKTDCEVIPASFCRLIRIDSDQADPQFVYYFLQNLYNSGGTWEYQNQSTGISNFQFELFRKNLLFPLMLRREQRAAAEILGILDQKMAINANLAGTAVELADAVFEATVRDVEFSNKTFADIATVRGGGTPRTGVDEYWDGNINWATPTDVTALAGPYLEATGRRITDSGLSSCASPLYPVGSILMTSRATIGAFAVAQRSTAVNQGFIVVNPRDPKLNWWVFHEMRSRVDEFVSLANGATFLELSRGNFKKFRVRLADSLIMKEFGAKADALHARARGALMENGVIAATRDVLLPQLMAGKIRVKDAEKTVEEVL